MQSPVCSRVGSGLVVGAAILLWPRAGHAQQSSVPQSTPSPPVQLAPYRPPAIALVQPAAGGSVPRDRPVVLFRFAPGEPNDPVDVASFAVSVDGGDRTAVFQISSSEAWGPLSPGGDAEISAGGHQVVARICSVRGACAEVKTTIEVAAPAVASPDEPAPTRKRRALLELLVEAARKLLNP